MLALAHAEAFQYEDVTYDVKSFADSGQVFPSDYLEAYPDRDTAIPQPTEALLTS